MDWNENAEQSAFRAQVKDVIESRRPARYKRTVTSIPRRIAAGSSAIQRNIIATRGLGLPRG